jgi:hypothetical protein
MSNNNEIKAPNQLYEDAHHIYPKLKGLLLCKAGILNIFLKEYL